MNKTPVSILQEMMVKQGMIPDYELIHDGGGRHLNTFTYQVTCDGLTAIGTGRCKKDAKHEAAKAMLTEIAAHKNYPQLPAATMPESPSKSPFHSTPPKIRAPNAPFFNAIGELQDLCAENNLEEPVYVPISDVGPPHARVFTIRCKISSFTEDGISTTKKQAKHEAAKKMIEKIQELVAGLNYTIPEKRNKPFTEENEAEIEAANEEAKLYYCSTKPKKINLGLKLSEYHVKWRESIEIEKRSSLLEELDRMFSEFYNDLNQTDESIMEMLERLQNLLSNFNIGLCMRNLKASRNYFMKTIELDTCPAVTHIGMGRSEELASRQAILQMIDSIKLLLS